MSNGIKKLFNSKLNQLLFSMLLIMRSLQLQKQNVGNHLHNDV